MDSLRGLSVGCAMQRVYKVIGQAFVGTGVSQLFRDKQEKNIIFQIILWLKNEKLHKRDKAIIRSKSIV